MRFADHREYTTAMFNVAGKTELTVAIFEIGIGGSGRGRNSIRICGDMKTREPLLRTYRLIFACVSQCLDNWSYIDSSSFDRF